jgi:peptide/nickel transport system substrate-binding protein
MNKIVFGIVCAALMLAPPAFAQKKSLVVGSGTADAGKLDPHIASTTPDKGLLNWMFNGLVRVRPGKISPEFIEPDLAESWTSNPAGTEWTFKLRRGVQCHHGYGEFTADDAVYSIKRASNKATSSYSNDFNAVDKVEALDKYTVKITLKNPVAGFLGYVANVNGGNQICKKAAEEMGENFAKKPIGTGPFMFAEYQPQQFVKLVANKQYFRGAPVIEDITYRYIPADSSRDLAFQSGELDMIYGKQDQTWMDRTSKLPGVKVAAMEPGELSVLSLNITVKPLDDVRVRQAIAHAIDRKAIVVFKGAGSSREAVSVVPSGYLGTDEKAPLYPYDVAKAKALLTEAGYPNGITIKTIHTTLTGMQTLIEAVQAQLKKAGINLDIETGRARDVPRADPQGPLADRPLPGGALSGGRRLSDAVLRFEFDRRHGDGGDQLQPLQRRRCRDPRRAGGVGSRQAESTLETCAGEDHQGGVRGSGLRAAPALGMEGHARSRLRVAGLAQPVAADHGEDPLHEVTGGRSRT